MIATHFTAEAQRPQRPRRERLKLRQLLRLGHLESLSNFEKALVSPR
jgi:hypothetical protein